MAVDTTSTKQASGGCCTPVYQPEVDDARAARLAATAKALADPIRVQIVDVLLRHSGEVCQCELGPLFDVSQPTLSHHLRKLEDAGLVTVERRGRWAYYSLEPDSLEVLRSWLS